MTEPTELFVIENGVVKMCGFERYCIMQSLRGIIEETERVRDAYGFSSSYSIKSWLDDLRIVLEQVKAMPYVE